MIFVECDPSWILQICLYPAHVVARLPFSDLCSSVKLEVFHFELSHFLSYLDL